MKKILTVFMLVFLANVSFSATLQEELSNVAETAEKMQGNPPAQAAASAKPADREFNDYEKAFLSAFAEARGPLYRMENDLDTFRINCRFAETVNGTELSKKCYEIIDKMETLLNQMKEWKSASQFIIAFQKYNDVFFGEFRDNMKSITNGNELLESANSLFVYKHIEDMLKISGYIDRVVDGEHPDIFIINIKNIIDNNKVSQENKELAYQCLQNFSRSGNLVSDCFKPAPGPYTALLQLEIINEERDMYSAYTDILR